jgi:hypothetical protein
LVANLIPLQTALKELASPCSSDRYPDSRRGDRHAKTVQLANDPLIAAVLRISRTVVVVAVASYRLIQFSGSMTALLIAVLASRADLLSAEPAPVLPRSGISLPCSSGLP